MTDHSYYLGLNTYTLVFRFLSEILQKPSEQITKFDFWIIENFSTILAKIFQNELFFSEFLTKTARRATADQASQLEEILTLMQVTISLLNSTLNDPNKNQTFVDASDSAQRQTLTLAKGNFFQIFQAFFSTQTPIKLITTTPTLHLFFFDTLFRISLSNPEDLSHIFSIYENFFIKINQTLSKAPTYGQGPRLSSTMLSCFKSILTNLYSLLAKFILVEPELPRVAMPITSKEQFSLINKKIVALLEQVFTLQGSDFVVNNFLGYNGWDHVFRYYCFLIGSESLGYLGIKFGCVVVRALRGHVYLLPKFFVETAV
jgi:hypothetical protein